MLKTTGEVGSFASLKRSESSNARRPVFSLHYMRTATGFSLDCCNDGERSAFSSFLLKFSQLTWQQVQNAPRHGLGSEKISWDSIKEKGVLSGVPEDATILAIRYNGKKPLIGYRDGEVLHVICLDHNFSVYRHG